MNAKDRLEIYENALDYYIDNNIHGSPLNSGMCSSISTVFSSVVYNPELIKDVLPEFWKQKPNNANERDYWWVESDMESRIKAFKSMIRSCKRQIKKEESNDK